MQIKNNIDTHKQPQFITKLLQAKQLLLTVKKKKLSKLKQKNIHHHNSQQIPVRLSLSPIQKPKNHHQNQQQLIQKQINLHKIDSTVLQKPLNIINLKKQLIQRVNVLSSQLQGLNSDITIYEIIFQRLCTYYKDHNITMRTNSKLKKQANWIKQLSEKYEQQNKNYMTKIQQVSTQKTKFMKYSEQIIKKYLQQVIIYNSTQLIINDHSETQYQNFINDIKNQQELLQCNKDKKIKLCYEEMREQLTHQKQTQLAMKKNRQKSIQDDECNSMQKFYQSELYNI